MSLHQPPPIDAHRVTPQNFGLGLVGKRLRHHISQRLIGSRGVRVRVVRVKDHVVVTKIVHHVFDCRLIGVRRHGALAGEILLGSQLERVLVKEYGLSALTVLLQPVQPKRHPARGGFQDEQAKPGEAVQDAALHEVAHTNHVLKGEPNCLLKGDKGAWQRKITGIGHGAAAVGPVER